jgi:hypothetical protein
MRFILLYILALSTVNTIAQSADVFHQENKAFVKVFIASKTYATFSDSIAHQLLIHSEIPYERFTRIMQEGIEGIVPTLNEAENKLLKNIQNASADVKARKWLYLKNISLESGLNFERYLELEQKFRRDIAFQQSLVPYFLAESQSK